jgi:hypothetical protein
MKTLGTIAKKRLLVAAVMASAVALVGVKVYADDASDIESFYTVGSTVSYDNTAGDDANGYPILSWIGSQPGTFGGHSFTGWSVFVEDETGSIELFTSQSTLSVLATNGSTPGNSSTTPPYGTPTGTLTAGMGLNTQGTWSPYDGIPEVTFTTTKATNDYIAVTSTGNAIPASPIFTIPQLEAGTANGAGVLTNAAIAGQIIELQNVTISGSTGSFQSTFPLETQANTVDESYTITDGSGNHLEMFDWTTSYSVCAAMGGKPVPTGPQTMYGFFDSFNEFVPLEIVPEPSTLMLAGMGLIGGLLAIRRRRS